MGSLRRLLPPSRSPLAFLFIAGSSRAYSTGEAAPDLVPSSSTASQCRVRHSPRRPLPPSASSSAASSLACSALKADTHPAPPAACSRRGSKV